MRNRRFEGNFVNLPNFFLLLVFIAVAGRDADRVMLFDFVLVHEIKVPQRIRLLGLKGKA
jgi:hypothetical protein